MSEPHGNDSKLAHASHAEEQDPVRTPAWLPVLGVGLLLAGALASYLWIFPGTLNAAETAADGGTGDAAANGEGGTAPTAAPPAQLPGSAGAMPQPQLVRPAQ